MNPWIFRAATTLKEPDANAGVLVFGMILDLGFRIYRQIDCMLDGYLVKPGMGDLTVEFAANWAENGEPNPLNVETLEINGGLWCVRVYRVELALETFEVIGRKSLGEALEEQGLVTRIKDDA